MGLFQTNQTRLICIQRRVQYFLQEECLTCILILLWQRVSLKCFEGQMPSDTDKQNYMITLLLTPNWGQVETWTKKEGENGQHFGKSTNYLPSSVQIARIREYAGFKYPTELPGFQHAQVKLYHSHVRSGRPTQCKHSTLLLLLSLLASHHRNTQQDGVTVSHTGLLAVSSTYTLVQYSHSPNSKAAQSFSGSISLLQTV